MKNKLRVLFDASPMFNAHAIRGVGIYTRLLMEHLNQIKGLKVLKSSSSLAKTFDPDVVHYPYFDFFSPSLPIHSVKKTVVTIYDVIPLIFPKYYPYGLRGSLSLRYQRFALHSVTAVVTVSQASKDDIVRHLGYPKEKIHVVQAAGNPAIKKTTKVETKRVRKKHGLPKNYVLYVGDINYNKNLPQLIKAVKFLPEQINLVLAGKNFRQQNIPEWQWISSQIELSDVKDRVFFANELTDEKELSAVYSGALCYVQPSLYEGFGLPVLEAMQAHTPVVSSENSSLIEVGNGHVVFVNSQAESLADGIMQVNAWPDSKRQKVINDAEAWAKSFSWKKTAQQMFEIYKKI